MENHATEISGESLNITQNQIEKLKSVFPEAITEGKIDWEKLQASLGKENAEFNNERYVLNWAGKAESFKVLQQPTTATLKPVKGESINFDATENVFIEGENLEVLKVLQKAYYGKVKVVVIDPPYNTGKDSFIYPDSFKESKEEYLKRIGEKDEEGYLMKEGLFRKNTKDGGHYHSNWLSMMYPRLFLAKNLLTEDGVIFIHIDDNEIHNLRLIMNEIFGEENFLAQLIWKNGRTAAAHFTTEHEYLLCFAKSKQNLPLFKFEGDETISDRAIKRPTEKNPISPIRFPRGIDFHCEDKIFPKQFGEGEPIKVVEGVLQVKNGKLENEVVLEAAWTMKDMIEAWIDGEDVIDQKGQKVNRFFFKDNGVLQYEKEKGTIHPKSIIYGITTKNGSNELKSLLGKPYFDFPKPSKLFYDFLSAITEKNNNDIILDFFAGSATTAQTVIELNKEDGGNRKFILVQFQEPCDKESEAFKAGYKTIADISKERIRKVIDKVKKEKLEKTEVSEKEILDLGFKVFRLSTSNFKIWRGNDITEDNLETQLDAFINPVKQGSISENILYELILKSGYLLTNKVIVEEKYFSINNGELIIVLEELTQKLIDKIILASPKKVITLDLLFVGNDQLKTNTVLQMKEVEIDFKTI